jgi:hypothetical protein
LSTDYQLFYATTATVSVLLFVVIFLQTQYAPERSTAWKLLGILGFGPLMFWGVGIPLAILGGFLHDTFRWRFGSLLITGFEGLLAVVIAAFS